MMNAISLSTLMCVAPHVVVKAQRLDYAISLLRSNTDEDEVRRRLRESFSCSQPTAWRIVDMAKDVA